MSKRHAEDLEGGGVPLKGGERPGKADEEDEVGEFEDEFEDEYESEDEILEAGVDGRPDAEREAEEKVGIIAQCADFSKFKWLILNRSNGCGPANVHSGEEQTRAWTDTITGFINLRNATCSEYALALPIV